MHRKLYLKNSNIKNQQRFPISKFGWPLKEASEIILKGQTGWERDAILIIESHINKRSKMKYLSEIYNIDSLKKWNINSAFIPWFSQKPQLNITDKDFLNINANNVFEKLCQLIRSIEKNGFIEDTNLRKSIIVYPLDEKNNSYYIRAGNHRVAVLSAMKKNIPCYLDSISYLKSRDKLLISNYFLNFNIGILNKNYPYLNSIENWPAVRCGTISKEEGFHIRELFCSENINDDKI